jgi:NAD+ kinase
MSDSQLKTLRVAITAHPRLPEALKEAGLIAEYLANQGVSAENCPLYDEAFHQKVKSGNYDLLIALGGDGTMLRAGHLCGPSKVPILGVNQGKFGFLTEIRANQWRSVMPRLLAGDYRLERRMMLCAEQVRDGELLGEWDVLNEVVVGRGHIVRPVHLVTKVDGRYLTTYVADALIASTPTGSTAYALAAGGPILPPELRTILLVAVAPHLSIDRAIVLAEGSTAEVTVHTDHQASVCIDGQAPIELQDGDRVNVSASDHTVEFIRFQDPGYFYRNLTPHMNQNPSTSSPR